MRLEGSRDLWVRRGGRMIMGEELVRKLGLWGL